MLWKNRGHSALRHLSDHASRIIRDVVIIELLTVVPVSNQPHDFLDDDLVEARINRDGI